MDGLEGLFIYDMQNLMFVCDYVVRSMETGMIVEIWEDDVIQNC